MVFFDRKVYIVVIIIIVIMENSVMERENNEQLCSIRKYHK